MKYIAHVIPTQPTIQLVGWEHCRIALHYLKEKIKLMVFPNDFDEEMVKRINSLPDWITYTHDTEEIQTEHLIETVYNEDLDREEFLSQLSDTVDTTLYSLQSLPEYKTIVSYLETQKDKIKTIEYYGGFWYESNVFIVIIGLEG